MGYTQHVEQAGSFPEAAYWGSGKMVAFRLTHGEPQNVGFDVLSAAIQGRKEDDQMNRMSIFATALLVTAAAAIAGWAPAILSGILIGLQPSDAGGGYYGTSTDTTPVTLVVAGEIGDTQFKIPKAYLQFSRNWEGGPQELISIALIVPSLVPLSLSNLGRDDPSVVTISIYSEGGKRTGSELKFRNAIEANIRNRWIRLGDANGGMFDKFVDKNNVEKYSDKNSAVAEFFIPKVVVNNQYLIIECVRMLHRNTGCTISTVFRNDIKLYYSYKRTELIKWAIIDATVRKFLDDHMLEVR